MPADLCRSALLVAVLCGLLPTLAAAQTDKYLLRYKFPDSEKLKWEVEHRVEINTTVNGHTQKASTSSRSTKVWLVQTGGSKASTSIINMVESVDMWQELTGRARVSYNSTTDKEPPGGFEAVAASVNVPLTVFKLDPQGKLLSRETKHKSPGAEAEASDKQLTIPLPTEAIAVGADWDYPHTIRLQDDKGNAKVLKARDYYKLLSVDNGVAEISMETQVLTPVGDPSWEAQLIQHTGKGRVWFDTVNGLVIKLEVNVDKTVVGFRGPASNMHYSSRSTERFVRETPVTARLEK